MSINSFSSCAEQIRIFTNTFTLTPYNGAEALVCFLPVSLLPYKHRCININFCSGFSQHWLFLQPTESLDPRAKYHSLTSGLGTNYTEPRQVSDYIPLNLEREQRTCVNVMQKAFCVFVFQMDIDEETSVVLYKKLLELEKVVRRKLSEENADK